MGERVFFLPLAHDKMRDIDETASYPHNVDLLGILSCATQYSLYPGQQLSDTERFGHVIVGANFQATDLVVVLGFGRQHYDGCLILLAADLLADLVAVNVRQHQIKKDAVGLVPRNRLQALFTGSSGRDLVAFKLQDVLEPARHLPLVFNDQYFVHGINWTSPGCWELRSPGERECAA